LQHITYRLPVIFAQNSPLQQLHGLFATAKLLVVSVVDRWDKCLNEFGCYPETQKISFDI